MSIEATVEEPARPSLLSLPQRYLERWMKDAQRFQKGFQFLVLVALGYAVCLGILALGGAQPGTRPWLAIGPARYFYWESLFIAPVIVV